MICAKPCSAIKLNKTNLPYLYLFIGARTERHQIITTSMATHVRFGSSDEGEVDKSEITQNISYKRNKEEKPKAEGKNEQESDKEVKKPNESDDEINWARRHRKEDSVHRRRDEGRDRDRERRQDRRQDDGRQFRRSEGVRDRDQRRDEWRDRGRYGARKDNRDCGRFGGGRGRDGWKDSRRDRSRGGEDDGTTHGKPWEHRPSADEVAKQKKMLWSKPNAEVSSSKGVDEGVVTTSDIQPKNAGLWSSAIAASGVGGQQANKFLKLMGIKNAPPVGEESADSKKLREESEKQKRLMQDLDRQYEMARESTHMGKGMGLGFHG